MISEQNLWCYANNQMKKISDAQINQLSASGAGEIYVATSDGVEKVNAKGEMKLITFYLTNYFYVDANDVLWFSPQVANNNENKSIDISSGFKAGIKSAIQESQNAHGQMPFQHDNLIRYDIKDASVFVLKPKNCPLSNEPVRYMTSDKNGNKYFVSGSGIYILKEPEMDEKGQSIWNAVYSFQGKETDYVNNQWCATCKLNDTESICIAKNKIGFSKNGKIQYKDIKLPNVTNMSNPFYNYFSSVAADKKGNIYIGTRLKSLYKYEEKACNSMNMDEKTAGKEIKALVVDQNDNLWIGTDKVLAKYDGKTFTYYHKKNSELTTSDINALYVDDSNTLWIGTDGGGLFSFDGANWKSFTKKINGLKSDKIEALTGYGNTIYFAASGELHTLNEGKITVENSDNEKALTKIVDNGLFAAPEGNLWIVSKGAVILCKKTDGTYTKFDKTNSPLPASRIREVAYMDGVINLHLERNSSIEFEGTPAGDVSSKDSERLYTFDNDFILRLKIK
jgi:ligand-binding sensor domain-containing protein